MAKPYLGFQNLGFHCKILGCHFDTQKRLKKHWTLKFCFIVVEALDFLYSYIPRCTMQVLLDTGEARKLMALLK